MKRRGSVMVFSVVMVAAMAFAIAATLSLTSGSLREVRRWEDLVRARLALEAATEQVGADYAKGTLTTLPTTRNVTINSVACSLTISEYDPMPHVIRVVGTMTYHGRSVTETRYIGMRKMPSPFFYSIFVDNSLTSTYTLATGTSSSNGDIYSTGNVTLSGTSNSIQGDLEATGSISPGTSTISGNSTPSAVQITWPAYSASNYSGIANATITKTSQNGYTFPSTANEYYLVYRSGNLSLSGSLSGKGTIVVDGTLTISGALTYANSSSRVAIIATSGITFSTSGTSAVGYFFTPGAISTPTTGLTISRGALVAKNLTVGGPLTITNDDAIWVDSAEGTKHRLPGFYP